MLLLCQASYDDIVSVVDMAKSAHAIAFVNDTRPHADPPAVDPCVAQSCRHAVRVLPVSVEQISCG